MSKHNTKFHELISKITFDSNTKESVLKTFIDWTKNNRGLQFIQKKIKGDK